MPADEFGFGKHYFVLDKKLEEHINSQEAHHLGEIDAALKLLQRIALLPETAEDGVYVLKATKIDGEVTYSWIKENTDSEER